MNYFSMLKIAISCLLLGFSSSSFALFEKQGVVKDVWAEGGVMRFSVCGSTCSNFYFSPDSNYGQAILSVVLTAKTTGQLIWVGGGDTANSSWPYYGAHSFSALHFMD